MKSIFVIKVLAAFFAVLWVDFFHQDVEKWAFFSLRLWNIENYTY